MRTLLSRVLALIGRLWFWDTLGYLVIPNVMDAAWLAAANAVLDPHTGVERVEVPLDEELMTSDECSALIAPIDGRHEVRVRSPLELPGALGEQRNIFVHVLCSHRCLCNNYS